ncbi:MAG: BatD family protein [Candidatus Aegiribacteria sp.]|nr:BatD family protein [Candidatus Aegiribacteria sp.]
MVILLCFLSLFSLLPDIEVSLPDSVRTGNSFSVDITLTGMDIRNVECAPLCSGGLRFQGSNTMHSFSSISTPSGRSTSSEVLLSMNFVAIEEGVHTVGPLRITSYGTIICEIPADSIIVTGHTPDTGTTSISTESEVLAWIEIEVDTTCRIYPGQPFQIDYCIYKTQRNAEIVDLYLDAAEYASSSLIEDSNELRWVRCKNGLFKAWLAAMEITPAFACSLELPVLRGRIGIPSGFYRGSLEHQISSEGSWIAVFPFPEEGQPDNFTGISEEVFFSLDKTMSGYSQSGEECILISITGPGASQLKSIPSLTIYGPASMLPGPLLRETDGGEVTCRILIEPNDSGIVIIGPDSLAWFDIDSELYRQSIILPCTLSVHGPYQTSIIEIDFNEDNRNSSILLIIISIFLIIVVIFLVMRRRFGKNSFIPDISDAQDPEELLTALEYEISDLLTDSPCYMGSEELIEALDARDADSILKGRILRQWKDIELMLSGRKISTEQLDRLKRTCIELVQELSDDLDS